MNKKILVACLAILAFVALSVPTYAAVQNIKLSGDLMMRGIARTDFDFVGDRTSDHPAGAGVFRAGGGAYNAATQSYLMSAVRVRLDADLTDNVSATVRVINERKWGNNGTDSNHLYAVNTYMAGSGLDINDDNIRLDLAYATLREFLYAPLTLTIGRQRMQFGNGMIIGDRDTNLVASTGMATPTNIQPGLPNTWGAPQAGTVMNRWSNFAYYTPAPDLSEDKSFDAIRATLNFDTMNIDLLYSKLDEQDPALADDLDLYGVNVGYKFNFAIPFSSEVYYFGKTRGKKYVSVDTANFIPDPTVADVAGIRKIDSVHTIGSRASIDPLDGLNIQLEVAGQFGRYNPNLDPNTTRDPGTQAMDDVNGIPRLAWATELSANYDFKKIKFNPKLGGVYAFFSGECTAVNGETGVAIPAPGVSPASVISSEQTWYGWDPMFENQTFGHIANALFKQTNMHIWMLKGSFMPVQDVTVDAAWSYYRFNKGYDKGSRVILNGLFGGRQYSMDAHKDIGNEIDLNVTYDYTEDVQFGLMGGLFIPGGAFMKTNQDNRYILNHKTASEVVGSMKVTF